MRHGLFICHVITWCLASAFLPNGYLRHVDDASRNTKLCSSNYWRPSYFIRRTRSSYSPYCPHHHGLLFSATTKVENDSSLHTNHPLQMHQQKETPSDSSTSSSSPYTEYNGAKKKISNRQKIKSMFRAAKGMERQGRWRDASNLYEKILKRDPRDAYSHLALARLEARRERKGQLLHSSNQRHHHRFNNKKATPQHSDSHNVGTTVIPTAKNNATTIATQNNSKARMAFSRGAEACPNNVHLKQAWAVFEESSGNIPRARELFGEALKLDERNPYVCHAFGLMEKKLGNSDKARQLFAQALQTKSTAALVCSMGELLIANREFEAARNLYFKHLLRLEKEKDKTEVYLAAAWLEERYFSDFDRANELIQLALAHSPGSGLAHVALARLEGRMQRRNGTLAGSISSGKDATLKRLANACNDIEKGATRASDPHDGRLFNAWANLELRSRRFSAARKILQKGRQMYPLDHSVSTEFPISILILCFVFAHCSPKEELIPYSHSIHNSCIMQRERSRNESVTSLELETYTVKV